MAAGSQMHRHCALAGCGETFEPIGAKRYCSEKCRNTGAVRRHRGRLCKYCKKPFTISTFRRFDSAECRRLYLEKRRSSEKPIQEPIAVLLPLGSRPRRCAVNPYAGEIPERRVFCRRYERCLSYAESQHWASFDCTKCDVQEAVIPYMRKTNNNSET